MHYEVDKQIFNTRDEALQYEKSKRLEGTLNRIDELEEEVRRHRQIIQNEQEKIDELSTQIDCLRNMLNPNINILYPYQVYDLVKDTYTKIILPDAIDFKLHDRFDRRVCYVITLNGKTDQSYSGRFTLNIDMDNKTILIERNKLEGEKGPYEWLATYDCSDTKVKNNNHNTHTIVPVYMYNRKIKFLDPGIALHKSAYSILLNKDMITNPMYDTETLKKQINDYLVKLIMKG